MLDWNVCESLVDVIHTGGEGADALTRTGTPALTAEDVAVVIRSSRNNTHGEGYVALISCR